MIGRLTERQRRRYQDYIQRSASATNINSEERPVVANFSSTPISTAINDEHEMQATKSDKITRSGSVPKSYLNSNSQC